MRVFLDTETTGFQPGQIAQLAYIITDDQLRPHLAKNFYFQVDSIDLGAARVTGLTVQSLRQLSQGRVFADCFPEIAADLANHPVICHNTAFDRRFMAAEYRRLEQQFAPRADFCTMLSLAATCGKRPKLEEAVRHFAIRPQEIALTTRRLFDSDDTTSHDARYDVTATLLVARKAQTIIAPWIRSTTIADNSAPALGEVAAAAERTTVNRPRTGWCT